MKSKKPFEGFKPDFLTDTDFEFRLAFPKISANRKKDIAPVEGSEDAVLHYMNYSVVLSASRRFPIYTASNIDGKLFHRQDIDAGWRKDDRARDFQWGDELYSADHSDFDKGHMTKREDVQWGKTAKAAQDAASTTFFYSNAVPQHKQLNRRIWKSLEDYILHTETKKNKLKICVFTGPVLQKDDPFFVTRISNEAIRIPVVFWKVIYYPKPDGKLYRVGFMMSQQKLLEEFGIVEKHEAVVRKRGEVFMQFADADTYQVNISLIEKLAELKFPKAIDSFTDDRSIRLTMEEIQVDPALKTRSALPGIGFTLPEIQL